MKYIPKVGEKCDYRPAGEKVYFKCVVIEVSKKLKNMAKISYQMPTGAKKEAMVKYPNSEFVACGKGLLIRTDCKKKIKS